MKEKSIKRDFTWYKLGGFILLFEAALLGLMVTYKYNFVAFIFIYLLWSFSALLGFILSLNLPAFKKLIPVLFFLFSFSPYLLFIAITLEDKLPLRFAYYLSIILLLLAPAGFFAGWLSLYLLSRLTKPQTTQNRTALFMGILWLSLIPVVFSGQKLVEYREAKDIVKSKQQAQDIINKLEEHHKQYTSYPQTLEGIQINKSMTYLPWFDCDIDYSLYNDSYCLEFPLPSGFISDYYRYNPKTQQWRRD